MTAIELADSRKEWANDLLSLNEWSIDAETMLRQQQTEIKDLKQQVAFLEDWRDTWSPTIKQLMNINVKAQEK